MRKRTKQGNVYKKQKTTADRIRSVALVEAFFAIPSGITAFLISCFLSQCGLYREPGSPLYFLLLSSATAAVWLGGMVLSHRFLEELDRDGRPARRVRFRFNLPVLISFFACAFLASGLNLRATVLMTVAIFLWTLFLKTVPIAEFRE